MSQPQIISEEDIVRADEMDTTEYPEPVPSLHVRSFGMTDRGITRTTNEDQFIIAVLVKALQVEQTSFPQPKVQHSSDRCRLFAVADGMGGHAGGAKASALALDSVETFVLETFKWFFELKGNEEDKVLAEFHSALAHANARVVAEGAQHPKLRKMGTTLTLAYVLNDQLFVAHVGDSRCYLFRAGALHRLTSDHTLVGDLVRLGSLQPEDAAHHHWRHVITNAVGCGSPEVKIEVHKVHLEPGDKVLLCSDGLTSMLSENEISHVLEAEDDPEKSCRQLVARANEEGGKDNITVVLAHFYDRHDERRHRQNGGRAQTKAPRHEK